VGEAVTQSIDLDPPETSSVRGCRSAESSPIESIYRIGKRYSDALRVIGVETVSEVARIADIAMHAHRISTSTYPASRVHS